MWSQPSGDWKLSQHFSDIIWRGGVTGSNDNLIIFEDKKTRIAARSGAFKVSDVGVRATVMS